MAVAQSLVDEACSFFGVVEEKAFNDGSQKTVRLVRRGNQALVLKVTQLGPSNPHALQRAVREVELLRTIDSDHVVRVESELLELGVPPQGAAWLEEALDGDDLANCVTQPWPWEETARFGLQIASGLSELHRRRVVHRDLSTNNVRCLASGDYKIMDPGYARHELLPAITVSGHPGTPGFMSPEHLQQLPAGPTSFSDVFSLGCLMWFTLAGVPPIPYLGDLTDYVLRLRSNQVESSPIVDTLTPPQREFLHRCIHRQPARRFRDGGDVAASLRSLV